MSHNHHNEELAIYHNDLLLTACSNHVVSCTISEILQLI